MFCTKSDRLTELVSKVVTPSFVGVPSNFFALLVVKNGWKHHHTFLLP